MQQLNVHDSKLTTIASSYRSENCLRNSVTLEAHCMIVNNF